MGNETMINRDVNASATQVNNAAANNSSSSNTIVNSALYSLSQIPVGTVLCGKYKVVSELNITSGEASLFICECSGKKYVAKIYRRDVAIKDDVTNALKNISSPHVAKLFDTGIYNGLPFEIIPFYTQGSLQGRTFSFEELKQRIIPSLNEGLHVLHKNGIIHKDLKPSNIMLCDSKLNQLKSKYRIPNAPSVATAVDPLQREMEPYQCFEVLQNVNKAISRRRDCAKKMKSIKEEIDGVLACPGCSTDRERLKYIKSNESILQQKKLEHAAVSAKMKKVQVVLLSEEKTSFNRLSAALAEINSSEKSTSGSGVALSSFVKLKSSIPGDIFASEQSPIELDYGAYKFFLLPDVVLAYDKDNSFVTAFDPVALIIMIRDRQKSVYMRKNSGSTWSYADSVVAGDSVLVSEGHTRTNWLHERKSGGPDLRYSYNPKYESRTDTYAYSDFSIQIGQYKAEYSISKANLSNKLKPMVKDYCSVMHELNAVPSLLRLLKSVSKKKRSRKLAV